ncbi:transcriptional regulator [halophilic archaeon]|nr:transcriptional regulator [halophilic archaeon]
MTRQNSGRSDPDADTISEAGRESFGTLANATRLEILDALATADSPLSYANLFERSSADDRGRFNYHLRQLRDGHVRKTDQGYELAQSGVWATNILTASVLQQGGERPFREIDSTCGNCGSSPVEIGYRGGEGIVRCRECDRQLTRFDFPPGAVRNLSLEDFVEAFAQRTRRYVGLADAGVCPFCSHRMTSVLRPGSATRSDSLPVAFDCSGCSAELRAPLGLVLSNRPRISATLFERGIDLDETPFWERGWCTFSAPRVSRTDPLLVALEMPTDDGDWTVVADENVDIRELDC